MSRPCMGGWCHLRDRCAHYEQPDSAEHPAERLCDPGQERIMFFAPLAPTDKSAEAIAWARRILSQQPEKTNA